MSALQVQHLALQRLVTLLEVSVFWVVAVDDVSSDGEERLPLSAIHPLAAQLIMHSCTRLRD